MKIIESIPWVYYLAETNEFEYDKVGKWMYFFKDKKVAAEKCENAVKDRIVTQAKHSNAETGVACFYLNCDDIDAHKKVISYFIKNNMIAKTAKNRFYNIPFKLDQQTRGGEYGETFKSEITLDKFIDLDSGEWLI